MFTTTLRTVGGSVMFAIPKAMLEGLGLYANQQVGVSIDDGRLIVEPKVRPRFALSELLAECDFNQPLTAEDRGWLNAAPVGGEII